MKRLIEMLYGNVANDILLYNKNKKFYLYYGAGGVGKTLLCNSIQLIALCSSAVLTEKIQI